ncbi:MAG TPA: tripartite tricarboxylate transporter substrate binding protein [Xanthobacteraceae bacterium]|jgi:tripartite-type tricarboxylate transporter receptor subunit TctC|nr:tripartite tricarboxylate transporter substrate binding protein [Xanthobacteraceae bacterium]
MSKWLGALVLLPWLCGAAAAQAPYPQRPITIIVTAAAGGVTDVVARALGQGMTKDWGQPVVIENRGGAAHILGAGAVAKAEPDGYTLMVAEAGTFTINPVIYPKGKLPYDTDTAFAPISGLVRINQALLADKKLPVKNAAELIALAKQKPGQLTFGTAGIGSAPHMNIELFENMAGVKFTPVHYRGATPALNDLRAGTVNLMSVSVSLALPPYRAGEIKMLGIGSAKRLPLVPDIPTVAETGLPGYQAVTWFGLFGPSAMPHDLVAKLNAEVQKVFSDPEFQKRFMEPQMFEAMPGSPQDFATFIKGEQAKWAKVIRDGHITLE